MTRHLRAVLPSSTSRDLGVPQKPQHRLSGPAAAKPRPRASMERVRAELDRLKASKEAMAEERARLMADGPGSDDVEMEDMNRVGPGQRGSSSFDGGRHRGVPVQLRAGSPGEGSPLTSPMGSLTGGDDASDAPRPGGGGTFSSEPASTTSAIGANESPLVPLSGINDDGYFGDASGNWLRLQPRARITFETRGAEDKSFAREVADFCTTHGGVFFGSLLSVAALTTALIVWASHLQPRSVGGGGGAR